MTTASTRIGIDINPPVDQVTGVLAPYIAEPALLADTGAGWVRLKFSCAPWSSTEDTTLHNGRTWEQTYRDIVDGIRAQGLEIYGLISYDVVADGPGESLRNPPPEGRPGHDWIGRYVASFVSVVELFNGSVQLFESFEEPDDWHGNHRNWVHPGWFSILLQQIYSAVHDLPHLADVSLVSGPLQGLAVNNNAAVNYLRETYREGKRRFGWGENGTPFPFDYVGYHLYIAEEYRAELTPLVQQEELRTTYERYLSGMRRLIREEEEHSKSICMSAMGWHTNRNPEKFQKQSLRQAMALILADPAVQLGIWCSLQDKGPADGHGYYGLYRPGELLPENRKPAYATFQEVCEQPLPTMEAGSFDNRMLIEAVTLAARDMGHDRYQIIDHGNLWEAFLDRGARYSGPPLNTISGLSDVELSAIRAKLTLLLGGSVQCRGETTAGALNMRAGPGTEHAVVDQLPLRTAVLVLQDKGEWLRIEAQGKEGFVHREFVALPDEQLPEGYLYSRPDLADLTLEPPPDRLINAATVQTPAERMLAFIWNRYGRLLAAVADELHVDPAVAEAVVAVESGGKGFAGDGRMIIRFENHRFYHYWGQSHPDEFEQHFRIDADTPWMGHRWRPSTNVDFREQHGWQGSLDENQRTEWEAFDFAATLDPRAARLSISMGAPQIMGSNYAVIGYESVEQMFDAFATSDHAQLLGFFDFVKANPQRVRALQRGDYFTFAELYNGSGQAEHYSRLIEEQVKTFDGILARQDAVSFGAEADFDIELDDVSFLPPIWPEQQTEVGVGGPATGEPTEEIIVSPMESEKLHAAWEAYMVQGLQTDGDFGPAACGVRLPRSLR